MKVFVIGNSGAGKTTHAERLADELGVVHLDLDLFAFVDQTTTRRDVSSSVRRISDQLAGCDGVLDGCYADIVEAMADETDTLIWLDTPVDECVERARMRPHEPHKWPTAEDQDAFLPELIEFIRSYPERTDSTGRAAHETLFRQFPGAKQRLE